MKRGIKILLTLSLASASFSQPIQGFDFRLWPEVRNADIQFVWGGIDQTSYVYWPTTPPDREPLRLVKSGQREKAFQYCMSKIDTTTGELRFFYSIQATTLGFGLFKSHLVIQKLMPQFDAAKRAALKVGRKESGLSTSELLAIQFAWVMAGHLGFEEYKSPRYAPIKKLLTAHTLFRTDVRRELMARKLVKLEHRAIAAVMSFYDPNGDREEAPDKWSQVIKLAPNQPEFYMVHKTLLARYNGTKTYTAERSLAPGRAAEKALALDPNYDRALYSVGMRVIDSQPKRAESLLQKYLDMGTGPQYEKVRAKMVLDYLKKVNGTQ